jgi:hypothetical protein
MTLAPVSICSSDPSIVGGEFAAPVVPTADACRVS